MKRRERILPLSIGIGLVGLLAVGLAQNRTMPLTQMPQARAPQALVWPQFFPLEVGNRWLYSDGIHSYGVEVVRETLEANGLKYFEVTGYFPEDGGDAHKLRRDLLGQIFEYNPAGPDFLWYRFANFRGAWRFESSAIIPCITGSLVSTGAMGGAISVPAGNLERTLRLDFAAPCMDAGIINEYFAPGIGLVQRVLSTIAGPRTVRLVEAHVGAMNLPAVGYGIELLLDRPFYYNNLMPPIVNPWPTAKIRLTVRNETEWPVEFTFPTGQRFDFIVRDSSGKEVLRWSDGKVFTQVVGHEILVRESRSYLAELVLKGRDDRPLPAGTYTLVGYLTTQGSGAGPGNISATVAFELRDLH